MNAKTTACKLSLVLSKRDADLYRRRANELLEASAALDQLASLLVSTEALFCQLEDACCGTSDAAVLAAVVACTKSARDIAACVVKHIERVEQAEVCV